MGLTLRLQSTPRVLRRFVAAIQLTRRRYRKKSAAYDISERFCRALLAPLERDQHSGIECEYGDGSDRLGMSGRFVVAAVTAVDVADGNRRELLGR